MTYISSHIPVGRASASAYTVRDLAPRVFEVALGVLVAAALAGAWLAFFSFVPFDLRLR